ncbi:MAG: SDR family oxidoreductase [Acidobacteriota bacterium]
MDRVLVTGISGFLGYNLASQLKSHYRVYGTYLDSPVELSGCESLAFDFCNLDKIDRFCEAVHPKVIVHTAARSDPDDCEQNHKPALTLNTFGTRELARAASRLGAKLIFLSTDLVFNGTQGFYTEADTPAPLNYYAKTKFLAELEIMNNTGFYATLRIASLYGRGPGHRQNFFETLEAKAKTATRMRLFTDQFRSSLFVDDAVQVIQRFIEDKSLKGLFHVGGPERLSRYEFAQRFCKVFHYPTDWMVPCRIEEAGLKALRPRDCSLRSDKVANALKMKFTPLETGLERLREKKNSAQQTQ